MLPGGRRFLFLARCSLRENNSLYEGSLDSGEVRRLARLDSNVAYVPARDGRSAILLFAREGKLFHQLFDGSRLAGEPVAAMDVQYEPIGIRGDFAVSADGRVLVTRPPFDENVRFTWLNREGKTLGTLGTPGIYQEPRIAPDGRRVVFGRPDDSGGNRDIWTLETDRGIAARLTLHPANEFCPTWSADSRRIVFASDRSGSRFGSMFEKSSMEPGADEAPVGGLPDFAVPMDWSADGRWIVFLTGGEIGELWVAPTFGNAKPFVFLATRFQERMPRFSPDGQWIAYHSNDSGRFEVYVRPFAGGPAATGEKVQISERGGYFATWGRDGKELFFLGPDSKLYAADVTRLGKSGSVASPRALFEACPGNTPTGGGTQGRSFDVAPDGRFLFLCGSEAEDHYSVLANWLPK
jgi:serine/threonine-protein kinase